MKPQSQRRPGRPSKSSMVGDSAARDRLITAAVDLMIEQRIVDIPVSAITARSGHNAALISYYFGSKSGLLMEVLRSVLGPGVSQLEHLAHQNIPPDEKLRIHISGMISAYFQYPFINSLIHFLINSEPERYGKIIVDEFSAKTAKIQLYILNEGKAIGLFKDVSPMHLYFHIVGACDLFFYGKHQMMFIFGIDEINAQQKREYVDYLTDGILNGLVSR